MGKMPLALALGSFNVTLTWFKFIETKNYIFTGYSGFHSMSSGGRDVLYKNVLYKIQ